jgi:hypothetical protein
MEPWWFSISVLQKLQLLLALYNYYLPWIGRNSICFIGSVVIGARRWPITVAVDRCDLGGAPGFSSRKAVIKYCAEREKRARRSGRGTVYSIQLILIKHKVKSGLLGFRKWNTSETPSLLDHARPAPTDSRSQAVLLKDAGRPGRKAGLSTLYPSGRGRSSSGGARTRVSHPNLRPSLWTEPERHYSDRSELAADAFKLADQIAKAAGIAPTSKLSSSVRVEAGGGERVEREVKIINGRSVTVQRSRRSFAIDIENGAK